MSNIITLNREKGGYAPRLELYDAKGIAVKAPALYSETLARIQEVAHRMFQKLAKSAEGKTLHTLTERGLTVEEVAEPATLKEAGVDEDWDELMELLVGAGAEAAVKHPVERLVENSKQILELEKMSKNWGKQEQDPAKAQIFEKFQRKYGSVLSPQWDIEAFIRQWLIYHQAIWERIQKKNGQGLDAIEDAFFKACKELARLRLEVSSEDADGLKLINDIYNKLRVKNDNVSQNN